MATGKSKPPSRSAHAIEKSQDPGLVMCLAALKHQQRCLARRIDEVRGLLEALESADDVAMSQDGHPPRVRRYGERGERTASA